MKRKENRIFVNKKANGNIRNDLHIKLKLLYTYCNYDSHFAFYIPLELIHNSARRQILCRFVCTTEII